MSAILKRNFQAAMARQFFQDIYQGAIHLYLVIGRSGAWTNEASPPVPTNSIADETSFRNNAICGIRINPQNVALVIPRSNWEVGGRYALLDTTSTNPYEPTANNGYFYCYSESSDNVYLLVNKNDPNGSGPIAGQEPVDKDKNIVLGGYTWSYLYNITAAMAGNGLLLDGWIPVPYSKYGTGGNLTSDQLRYGGSEGIYAAETLGAHCILMSVTLTDAEGDLLPEDISFRQIGIIADPKDNNGNFLSGAQIDMGAINSSSGTLIYLENRTPINRTQGQNETVQIIFSF